MKEKEQAEKNTRLSSPAIAVTLLAAAILGISGVSLIRQHGSEIFPVKTTPAASVYYAEQWKKALSNNNEQMALLCAKSLIDDTDPPFPPLDYIRLLYDNRMGTLFLSSPLGHFDYIRWQDARRIRKILKNTKNTTDAVIPYIFNQVLLRKKPGLPNGEVTLRRLFQIKIAQLKDKPYTSIIDIWDKGYASMEEIFRLMSSFAFQAGYDVEIVSFYTKNFRMIHTVCEIRNSEHSYVCDPLHNRIWKEKTVLDLIRKPEAVQAVWPKAILKKTQYLEYSMPAEAADYRIFNQKLYQRLKSYKLKDLPRFGTSPYTRIETYIKKYAHKTQNTRFSYWNFPFQLLKSSPDYPDSWNLPPQKDKKKGGH